MKKKNGFFTIIHQDKKTKARLGVINTAHGKIHTPAFIPVGTQGSVKSLSNEELNDLGIEAFFVNTYHLYLKPGKKVIQKFGGIHRFVSWKKALMSDSGGFQLFSLARKGNSLSGRLVKVDNDKVVFTSHWDGKKHIFTPQKSIDFQKLLATDIVLSFDECAFYPLSKKDAASSVDRTHRWAELSLQHFRKQKEQVKQAIYGVVQGSVYKDLREMSAKFISTLGFDGIAIGGVSVGEEKKEMLAVCDWVIPCLADYKPRHLLGVGEIDDIFSIIERGVDTFDCVMPTRLGRMGHILTMSNVGGGWTIDITKSKYSTDMQPLDRNCTCYACLNYCRSYVHHLFKVRELLAYRLATIHNLFFVQTLMERIRQSIKKNSLFALKEKWLYNRAKS